jgi:hypothetical protein
VVPRGGIFLGKWRRSFAEIRTIKWMCNQPTLWTPGIYV